MGLSYIIDFTYIMSIHRLVEKAIRISFYILQRDC